LFFVPAAQTPDDMFWRILITMIFYMPTISMSNTVMYAILSRQEGVDVVKVFPPIRVWGTVGFIVALWIVSLTGHEKDAFQFYLGGISSLVLGLYAFTLPACPPLGKECLFNVQGLSLRRFLSFRSFVGGRFAIDQCLWGCLLA
jgi:NHS family xanthosine MFS transporter